MMGYGHMMGDGYMGGSWLVGVLFLYVIPVGLTVWAVVLMSRIHRALEGIGEALRDIAGKKQ